MGGYIIFNKKILLTLIFVLSLTISISAIYASDVNSTDSTAVNLSNTTSNPPVYESTNNISQSHTNTLSINQHNSDSVSSTFKTIIAKDITKYYKSNTKYSAKLLDNNGKIISNTNVKIIINGHTYTKKTDNKGIVTLDVNFKPGTYKITTTNPKTGYTLTTSFKILSTISARDVTKIYADDKKFHKKFLKSNGKALANKKVKFKIKGKTYTSKTDKNGEASLSLSFLSKGTYNIISYNNDGLTKTNKIKVVTSTSTYMVTNPYTFLKNDNKKIKVRLLNKYAYSAGKNHIIKFKIDGKTYTAKTNKNGYAELKLPSLSNGVHWVKYTFDKSDSYKASSAKSKITIIPNKNPTFTVKSTKTFGQGAGTLFKLSLTSGNIPLTSQTVKITVNGDTYTKKTNNQGIISLPINLKVGTYKISYSNKATSKINSKHESTNINVIKRSKTTITWKSTTSFYSGKQVCQVQVLDANKKAISGANIKLTINSKTYTAKTSSNGYASISTSFTNGNYKVSYNYDGDNSNAPSSGSTSLKVSKITTISIKSIVSAASTLKSYYANHKKLPASITAGGVKFTVPEFLYLMSEAIYHIGNSKTKTITYMHGISAPSTPTGDSIHGDLQKADYINVAKNTANFIRINKRAPNFATSSIGKIAYDKLVDAESRILAFYKSNKRLPNYSTIITSSGSASQAGSGLNEKNTITDLSAYLKSTTHCQVSSSAIKSVVKSVTKGLKSKKSKANAIFNYVKNTLSYSFYYNTKYGAVATLHAKKGNCVDHAHLLVAMFRAAKIPARYVHGTCKFNSGHTYGHVWAQVLVKGKWRVADATGSKNKLGSVANWNTKSYSLKAIYISLPF